MVGGVRSSVLQVPCAGILLVILAFCCVTIVSVLSPGGKHVITKLEVYFVYEHYETRVISSYQKCTKTGWWLADRRRCRTIYFYKTVTKIRRVSKTRVIWVCANGYKELRDECKPSCGTYGCRHGGTCIGPGMCQCSEGWKGDKCEEDVNECSYNSKHRCAYQCENTQGSYYCKCRSGYQLTSNRRTCEDIDECRYSYSNPCGSQSKCSNTLGSYRCRCKTGFTSSNGKSCKDIDECASYHGCAGTCYNTYGSYRCACDSGSELHNEKLCKDVDECKLDHGCEYKCVNFFGSYRCTCQNGYEVDSRRPKSCTDIDECSRGTSGCPQKCINNIGSFTCSCRTGYVLARDKRTCNDIDECKQNNGGCIQNCVNTIGSYHCSCKPGYDLNTDKRTCQGKACRPIHVPRNAIKHCNGHTTASVCTFTCIPGYEITNPTNHTCLPSKYWSGKTSVCSPIDCEFPTAPVNGFTYDSCNTEFKSECQVGCDDGFFANGNFTMKCGALKKWEPEIISCVKSATCHDKVCLRNGVCASVGINQFTCNCSGTGYKGKRCEIGEISTPGYEVMKTGQTSDQLEFLASSPSNEVIVTPLSEGATFNPPSLIFTPEIGKLKVKRYTRITAGNQSGVFQVRYAVSGNSSEDYYPIQPDLIVIYSSTNQGNDIDLKKVHGCHQILLYKCHNKDNYITAGSTSPWTSYDENYITSGIVSIQSQHIDVPLSISGASLPKPQEKNDMDFQNLASQPCDSFSPSQIPLEKLTTSRAQENSYLHNFQTKLPNWIKLNLPSNGKILYGYQLGSSFLNGRQLKDRLGGYEKSLIDNNLYSIQFVAGQAEIMLGKEIIEISHHGKSAPITLAMALCGGNGNGSTNVALIALPTQSLSILSKLDILKRFRQAGWDILPRSLMIANDLQVPRQTYYNGIDMVDCNISNGNIALQLEIKKKVVQNEFFNSTIDFDGTATAEVSNVSKILDNGLQGLIKVSLDGKTRLHLGLSILGNLTQVKLESDKSSSYMDLGEATKMNKSKLLINSILKEDPFKSSLLGNFLELGRPKKISMSIDVPLNISDSENELEPTSLQFHGKVKDGALVIPDLNIQTHISQPRPNQEGGIHIVGKGTQKSLGNLGKIFKTFADLPLEVNITIPSVGPNILTVFKATVEILGMRDTVLFNFSKGYATWKSGGSILKIYKVKYNALLNVEDKTLNIEGYFEDGPESLQDSLSEGANKVARNAYNKATKRLDEAKKSEINFRKKLEDAKRLYEQNERKVNDSQRNVDLANENVLKIKNELENWETSAKDSSETLTLLRERMNKLCNVKICDPICQVGTVCSACYDYIEENVRGECVATCYTSSQSRVPPFSKIDACVRQECSYVHRRGFWPFIGKIIKFAATVVLSAFVPPPIAKGIVDAGEALIKTGSLGTALCTFAKTAVTGGILNSEPTTITGKLAKTSAKVVSNVINCGKTPTRRHGRWNCYYHGVPCKKGVFNYEYVHTPYTCTKPCQKIKVTERIPYQCCDRDECAIKIPDTRCVIENTHCQRIRDEALSQVAENERKTAAIIRDYDKKRKQHFDQVIELAKAKLKMKLTERKLDIFKGLREIYMRSYNNSKMASELLEKNLKPILKHSTLMKANKKFIEIKKIRFFTTQQGEWSEHRLLLIDIHFEFPGNKQAVVRTVLDFNNLERSKKYIQKEIVEKVFGNIAHVERRRRRSVDTDERDEDESISSMIKYHKLCSSFTNSLKILQEVFTSLNNLVIAHINNITQTKTTPTFERSFSSLDIKLNKKLAEELGINKESLKDDLTTEDNALMDKIEHVFNISSEFNVDQMKIESNYFYSKWYASMENVFNRTATDCSGFGDCLNYAKDVIFELFNDFYTNKTHHVFGILIAMDKQIDKFSPILEISVIDALNISNYTLSLIAKLQSQENIFCFQAPNITHHPPATMELSVGEDLFLVCNATGYALSFGWQFDGTVLEGQDSNVLQITSVTRCSQGSYRCVVSNHMSTEKSSPTLLIMKTAPKITQQPVPYLDPKIGSTAYLESKGESSDLNSMNYSWIYQSIGSTKFTVLPHQIYPVMSIDAVSSKNKGYYRCTVSNAYGTTQSTSTFLDPLRYSLPSPSLTIVLSIESIVNNPENLKDTYPKVAEHLQSFLQEKVKSVAGSVTVDVVNPRVTSGRLHPKDDDITSLLITQWQAQLKIKKIVANGNTKNEISSVQISSNHLQATYKKVSNYINSGKRHITVVNVKHNLLPKTFGVTKLVMECPKGQSYDKDYLSCVNCPSGSRGIVDSDALTICQPCEIGTYQPNQGEVSCISCIGNLTTASKGSRNVKDCKVICEAGNYAEVIDNRGECIPCPNNTYQPLTGQSACLPCLCSFVTNGVGKISEKDCEPTNDVKKEIPNSDSDDSNVIVAIFVIIIVMFPFVVAIYYLCHKCHRCQLSCASAPSPRETRNELQMTSRGRREAKNQANDRLQRSDESSASPSSKKTQKATPRKRSEAKNQINDCRYETHQFQWSDEPASPSSKETQKATPRKRSEAKNQVNEAKKTGAFVVNNSRLLENNYEDLPSTSKVKPETNLPKKNNDQSTSKNLQQLQVDLPQDQEYDNIEYVNTKQGVRRSKHAVDFDTKQEEIQSRPETNLPKKNNDQSTSKNLQQLQLDLPQDQEYDGVEYVNTKQGVRRSKRAVDFDTKQEEIQSRPEINRRPTNPSMDYNKRNNNESVSNNLQQSLMNLAQDECEGYANIQPRIIRNSREGQHPEEVIERKPNDQLREGVGEHDGPIFSALRSEFRERVETSAKGNRS